MSREGFVPSANLADAAMGFTTSKASLGVKYICANCSHTLTLNKNDPVRCKECGHRVLYKARTKRMGKCDVY